MKENKKDNTNKMKKSLIIGISIICVIIASISILVVKNLTDINSKEENRYTYNETILFEEVGHYGIAYAGCNNSDRGTAIGTGVNLITNYPENWNDIKKNIPNNILSKINNMTGSRLDFDGTVKKAWLTTFLVDMPDSGNIDILIIKPNGTYQIIPSEVYQTIPISITESGWYYVSFLDTYVQPDLVWAITSVYENDSLPMKYMSINYAPYLITGSEQQNYRDILGVTFDGPFKTAFGDEFELYGVVIGGGYYGAWAVPGVTEDKLEVKLSDGTYKQLYEDTYKGKTIFAGRTNTDFFNCTFNTIRSHNIKSGELDIFHEKINKDYFGNKDVVQYRATMMGSDGIATQLFGLTRNMVYPNVSINSEITNQTSNKLIEDESVHVKIDVTNNSVSENRPAYKSTITCKLDNALSNVDNIEIKVDGASSSLVPIYNNETNEVIINNIEKILPGQVITIEYNATINSNIQNKGEINTNIELPIDVNVKVYSVDIETINSSSLSSKGKYDNSYNEMKETVKVTGVYTNNSDGVEVRYIDEVTGEEIELSETKTGFQGEEYQTEEKEIEGYEIVEVPTNKVGTFTENKITVIYKYRKISKVIVRYVDINNGEEIERIENTYKEGESYIAESKEIEGYRLIETPENISGTVEREDIIIEYGYKKIVIGVEVKYIDKVTGEEIESKEIIKGIEGEKYETRAKEIEGYKVVEEPINASGEIREDTIILTYKYRKVSKVIVRHMDLDSKTEIEREEKEYKEGESYTTEEKEISGYKIVEIPANKNGIVEREDIVVEYGYKKIARVVVKHIDKEANVVIKEEKIEGVIGEKYSTRKLESQKYNFVEVIGDIEGNLSEESIEIVYYYEKKQAIVEIIYEDENRKEIFREIMEGKVGENYKVEIMEIENYKIVEKPENIEGKYTVEEIVVRIRVEKIKIKVEINIVDENGNIIEVIEKEGYVGDKEEIELPEVDGYYTEDKNIVIEYGKENNISVVYKKKLFDLPNTSDINIYVYIGIFVVSIVIVSYLISIKIKKE